MARILQKSTPWKAKFSSNVRQVIARILHFPLKLLIPKLRNYPDHSTLISNATYSPWRTDEQFLKVMQQIKSNTLLDSMRLYEIWQLANQVNHLSGYAIEIGSWQGGSGCLIAYRLAQENRETKVFLCDTFRGIVKASKHDLFYQGGELASDEQVVKDLVTSMQLKNVIILPGIFPEETGDQVKDYRFKFAHIDVDVYQSARDAFEWLLPRLTHSAIVVFDDYGFFSTNGIRAYIDELQGRQDLIIIRNLNGQAVVIKC
ncbi:Macrocin-O-methyltransferase (TylF) [Legionella busanensis]|uniref:Macrocin-O-methyltransferase (TylF) n=1 Tax=Legionella busanensis TaxID=190655 RepID=A0A378JHE0_9GAMM|nr:TylF/MycF/NovP-related O-methyltransferase [Legionella busanensis]STX50427.1 Macrocin-O-methyltransferase (TylF) [Legionella busanensis]